MRFVRWQAVSAGISSLLEDVRSLLPEQDIAHARELLEHDEFGLALSLIATQLYEYEAPIERRVYDQIATLGREMAMPPAEWVMLEQNLSN
jgi:hypothetical protein